MLGKTLVMAVGIAIVATAACGGLVESPSLGAADGGSSSGVVSPPIGRPPPSEPPEPPIGSGLCPTTDLVTAADIGLTWLPPGPAQEACTQQDVDGLRALLAAPPGGATYAAIRATLGVTCSACVFTEMKGPRWGMLITNGPNVIADNTTGACFAAVSTTECGKARFELDACLDIVCPATDCGPDTSACSAKAIKGACKSFVSPYVTACKDESALIDRCSDFATIVTRTCGAGVDGGP